MKTRKAIVAAFGATALAATAGGMAVAQLSPTGGAGGAGGNGAAGGAGAPSTNNNVAACTPVNNGGTTNIVTRSKSSCRGVSANASIRNASNGGKGGHGGNGVNGGDGCYCFSVGEWRRSVPPADLC